MIFSSSLYLTLLYKVSINKEMRNNENFYYKNLDNYSMISMFDKETNFDIDQFFISDD